MTMRNVTRTVVGVNVAIVVVCGLLLWTPLLDVRDYAALPKGNADWRQMVAGIDGLAQANAGNRLANRRAFRTLRSAVVVKERVSKIGEYVLTGQTNHKAYFLHSKTNALVIRAEGEMLEDYMVTKVDENGVELEKDGAILEMAM